MSTTQMTVFNRRDSDTARQRRGFTLLEVVAALVLMTMLFAAITSLLRCFGDQRKALQRITNAYPSTQPLADLLRRDIANASFVNTVPGRLTLLGNIALDSATGSPTGRRAEVTYRIDILAGEPWLMRREVQLDELSSRRNSEEPIWQGATGIELIAESVAEEEASETIAFSVSGMKPMPPRLMLVVRGDEGSLLQLHIMHHWESN